MQAGTAGNAPQIPPSAKLQGLSPGVAVKTRRLIPERIDDPGADQVPVTGTKPYYGHALGAIRHALSNSFGFGGINACLALSRVED